MGVRACSCVRAISDVAHAAGCWTASTYRMPACDNSAHASNKLNMFPIKYICPCDTGVTKKNDRAKTSARRPLAGGVFFGVRAHKHKHFRDMHL